MTAGKIEFNSFVSKHSFFKYPFRSKTERQGESTENYCAIIKQNARQKEAQISNTVHYPRRVKNLVVVFVRVIIFSSSGARNRREAKGSQ